MLAFRNQGDLTFKEIGADWGFNSIGVANGMALADLDNDGDLDVVINRLNGPAQLLRNEASAPRLGVRLRGKGANTRAVGARIEVAGHGKPQSQTVLAGGRYLSSDEGQRSFAAAETDALEVQITWPDRTRSTITNVTANSLLEISQEKAPVSMVALNPSLPKPLFTEVPSIATAVVPLPDGSDFAKSPWLVHERNGRHGGLAWLDVNGDGTLDLILAQGPKLAAFAQKAGPFAPMAIPQPEGGRVIWRYPGDR